MTSDKYPEETDRRRFVKGVVGGAALSAVGAGTATAINSATNRTGRGGGATKFYGVENTDGPAPRAMPQIVVDVDDEGFVKGRFPKIQTITEAGKKVKAAQEQIADITYSNRWFQFCGVQTMPGIRIDTVDEFDEYFRYAPEGQLPPGLSWQKESDAVKPGGKVHVDHFSDYAEWGNGIGRAGIGKPAKVTWRSKGLKSEETIICELIRSERIADLSSKSTWLKESTDQAFLAYLDKCTHFCCVPSFKGYSGSAKFGAANEIYCPCHQSVYDPFSIVKRTFTALPRPEEV